MHVRASSLVALSVAGFRAIVHFDLREGRGTKVVCAPSCVCQRGEEEGRAEDEVLVEGLAHARRGGGLAGPDLAADCCVGSLWSGSSRSIQSWVSSCPASMLE